MAELAAPIIGAVATKALSGSSSSGAMSSAAAGKSFTGGGINATTGPTNVTVGSLGSRQSILNKISGAYGANAEEIRGLLPSVAPGVGNLTESAVTTLGNKKRQAIGNLRENLSRRRVLGSSFAADAETRTALDYDQAIKEAKAQSFLQELDLTTQLIDKAHQSAVTGFNTILQNLNLEAEIGLSLATNGQAALSSLAGIQAELSAKNAAGAGEFVGSILGPSMQDSGAGIADFFKNLGGGGMNQASVGMDY